MAAERNSFPRRWDPCIIGFDLKIIWEMSVELANDWRDELDAGHELGIAVDVYNVWWDPNLPREIARAAKRICAFQISDWLRDTTDLRFDRGMMGDGVIDIPKIRKNGRRR